MVLVNSNLLAKTNLQTPANGLIKVQNIEDELVNHSTSTKYLAIPVIPNLKTFSSNKGSSCDDNAFITSGNDLIQQIQIQGFDCVERLFGQASDAVRVGTFTQANIATIAGEAQSQSISYDGTDTNQYIRSLFYWIKAFYYYGNREYLTAINQDQTQAAINALVENTHFYDKTEVNARVISHAMANLNNALVGDRFVPLLNDMLDNFDQSYNDIFDWGNVLATVSWDTLNTCANSLDCRVAQHTTQLVAKIGDFIIDNVTWLDKPNADFHLHNLGYQLANFYSSKDDGHFQTLRAQLETHLHYIFNNYGPLSTDTARRAYLQAMSRVNQFNKCDLYNLCSKKEEITTEVLNDRINCSSGTLFFWAQDMNQTQLDWACESLGAHEAHFHTKLQTNEIPVTPDDNDSLRMVVFNNRAEWQIYGGALFGADTNNGGLYLEGDPSTSGDQATFFAYEDVPQRPIFDIWNLRHEYIHYLDGRFIKQGDFQFNNNAGRTVWYGEGVAEYISLKDCNDNAIAEAATGSHSLSTIFQNEYGVSQTRVYPWGYLATRFMFENHNSVFFDMLDLFKQGNYIDYRSTMVDVWVNNQTFDAEFSSWLNTVDSTGCFIDNTRPPSPIEPINIDDIQESDLPGIDMCGNGATPSNEILAGVAMCLEDTTNSNQLQMQILSPSGLVNVTLEVTLRYGSGNTTLLQRFDSRPTDLEYDNISNESGVEQTLLASHVQSGWNYIHVRANESFSGVTLLARYIQNPLSDELFSNGFE